MAVPARLNNIVGYSHDENTPVLIARVAQISDPDSQNRCRMTYQLTNAPDNSRRRWWHQRQGDAFAYGSSGPDRHEDDLTVTLFTPANSGEPTTLTITAS